jgi:hypothetical protein
MPRKCAAFTKIICHQPSCIGCKMLKPLLDGYDKNREVVLQLTTEEHVSRWRRLYTTGW